MQHFENTVLPSPEQLGMLRSFTEQLVKPSEDEWAEFASCMRLKHIPKKGFFLRAGEVCSSVAFITRGAIRYYHEKDGNEYSTNFTFENGFATDYDSFLTRQPSHYSFSALEPTDIIVFHYNDVQSLYHRSKLWERFGRLIAERIFIEVQRRKNSLVFDSPEEQYCRLITDCPKILERVPQHMIATYLGITPVHLSRIRRKVAGK
ncbi:MAG: Crp/Fnr family transcriptional regulator [Ignavibacteriae bacterium]|nr:Crp/Fnr family transcriptional regulator [Ignavibacteriota bacterium]